MYIKFGSREVLGCLKTILVLWWGETRFAVINVLEQLSKFGGAFVDGNGVFVWGSHCAVKI